MIRKKSIQSMLPFVLGLMICCTGCSSREYVSETETERSVTVLPVTFRVDPVTNQSDNQQFVLDYNAAFADTYYMEASWLTESTDGYRNKLKQWNVLDELPLLITDAGFDYEFYRILAENDRLVDLRPWMENSDFWMEAMNEDVLEDITEEDGSIYLAPLGSNVHTYAGIIYNEELLRQAGYETFPETWEDFFACLDALEANGVTPLALHGAGSYWVPMLFGTAYLSRNEAGQEFLSQGFPDTYRTREVEDMMTMIRRIFRYTFEDALEIDYDLAAQRFLAGEAAIIANGKWMFDSIDEATARHLQFTTFPEKILMNSPRMSAWAVTAGYSEEVTEGAVKALEFRIQCEQEEAEELLNTDTVNPLASSYAKTVSEEHTIMPNYQLQWEQELQNEFFSEYLPQFLKNEIRSGTLLRMMDEKVEEIKSRK